MEEGSGKTDYKFLGIEFRPDNPSQSLKFLSLEARIDSWEHRWHVDPTNRAETWYRGSLFLIGSDGVIPVWNAIEQWSGGNCSIDRNNRYGYSVVQNASRIVFGFDDYPRVGKDTLAWTEVVFRGQGGYWTVKLNSVGCPAP